MSVWKKLLAAVVRYYLTVVAAWLVARGVIDEALGASITSEGTATVVALLVEIGIMSVPLFWSLREKLQSRVLLETALGAAPGTELEVIEQVAREKGTRAR